MAREQTAASESESALSENTDPRRIRYPGRGRKGEKTRGITKKGRGVKLSRIRAVAERRSESGERKGEEGRGSGKQGQNRFL